MARYSYTDVIDGLCNSSGNTWLPYDQVKTFINRNHGSMSDINSLVNEGTLKLAQKNNQLFITLQRYYQAEIDIVNNVFRIMKAPHSQYSYTELDRLIDRIEQRKNAKLHVNQREAVKKGVNNSFLVLTGGPGTGKTFVLSFINDVIRALMPDTRIDYAAPTGKAARRITESTGFYATTLHSKLRISVDHMEPTPLSKDIRVMTIDEISMLDIWMMLALMQAVQTGTKLILVGDTDQLPSVGPGAILRDLIASGVVPVAALTATFRQAGDSDLFDNIQRIKSGNDHLVSGRDFKIAVPKTGLSAQEILLWMYKQEIKEWDGPENVMCLTPFRKNGDTCSNQLNIKIQDYVNPTGATYRRKDGVCFRKGDLVMQQENRERVANGDIGVVTDVYPGTGVSVKFYDCVKDYGSANISDITLSYAMSIHKSQGSEAKSVVTLLLNEHKQMLQRNLLYTAVTRAKKKCSLLCEPEAVTKAVQTEASSLRVTMLKELLQYKATGKYE